MGDACTFIRRKSQSFLENTRRVSHDRHCTSRTALQPARKAAGKHHWHGPQLAAPAPNSRAVGANRASRPVTGSVQDHLDRERGVHRETLRSGGSPQRAT
jgi:hypothetical protein